MDPRYWYKVSSNESIGEGYLHLVLPTFINSNVSLTQANLSVIQHSVLDALSSKVMKQLINLKRLCNTEAENKSLDLSWCQMVLVLIKLTFKAALRKRMRKKAHMSMWSTKWVYLIEASRTSENLSRSGQKTSLVYPTMLFTISSVKKGLHDSIGVCTYFAAPLGPGTFFQKVFCASRSKVSVFWIRVPIYCHSFPCICVRKAMVCLRR